MKWCEVVLDSLVQRPTGRLALVTKLAVLVAVLGLVPLLIIVSG